MTFDRLDKTVLPSVDDFDMLKDAVLAVAEEPDAHVRGVDQWRLYVQLERDYVDLDFLAWPPMTIRFTGMLALHSFGSSMVLRYRELSQNNSTVNSSVNHDYILRRKGGELVEFGHSIHAAPLLPQPRQEHATDEMLDQSDAGERLLRANLSGQLELSEGDCIMLFERLAFLTK